MMTMLFGPIKAGFQVLCDDEDGARETMDKFTKTNPLVMPVRLGVELVSGNTDDAEDTLKTFGNSVGNMACATPVLGHTIAAGYSLAGKEEKAERIFKQATRTTVVAGAGIIGSAAGPAGAAALAVAAGTEWDLIDAARGKGTNGVAKLIETVAEKKEIAPGDLFDAMMVPVCDGMTGVAAAKTYDKFTTARRQNQLRQEAERTNGPERTRQFEDLSAKVKKQGVKHPNKVANGMCKKADDLRQTVADNESQLLETEQRYHRHPRPNAHVNGHTSVTMMDEHGNQSTGYSRRLADAQGTPRLQPGTSRLEQAYPDVQPVLRRPLNACAEHMAYQNITNPVVTYALQVKDGIVQCIKRCENCEQYPLANVITDSMNGTPVPYLLAEVPVRGSYIGGIVSGTILIDVAHKRR